MMAASVAWIYADRIAKTPKRRHAVEGRRNFAFSDVRRSIIKAAMEDNFSRLFPVPAQICRKFACGSNAAHGGVTFFRKLQ